MNITLYKQTKDRDIIEKKLTEAFNFTAYARKEFDIENPVITVESNVADITKYNYVYIEDYHRYYFINKHRALRTGVYELECEEDYLYTWKDTFLNWTVQIERAEGLYNTYFNDNKLEQIAGNNITTWKFSDETTGNHTGFTDDEHFYILTAGGD